MPDAEYTWTDALQRALKRNRRDAHNRYLQLATLRADGSPAVRTLVFRGLCAERDELRMVTDQRSEKADEIDRDARGEIAWYFSHTREQFRLRGLLRLSGGAGEDQSLRRQLWDSLSDAARAQFFWAHPGKPLRDEARKAEITGEPPENFAALCLRVDAVDHLVLKGDPQLRLRGWRTQGTWQYEAVNP